MSFTCCNSSLPSLNHFRPQYLQEFSTTFSFTSSAINDCQRQKVPTQPNTYTVTHLCRLMCACIEKLIYLCYQSLSAITHSSGMNQFFTFSDFYIIDSPLILGHPKAWLTQERKRKVQIGLHVRSNIFSNLRTCPRAKDCTSSFQEQSGS